MSLRELPRHRIRPKSPQARGVEMDCKAVMKSSLIRAGSVEALTNIQQVDKPVSRTSDHRAALASEIGPSEWAQPIWCILHQTDATSYR